MSLLPTRDHYNRTRHQTPKAGSEDAVPYDIIVRVDTRTSTAEVMLIQCNARIAPFYEARPKSFCFLYRDLRRQARSSNYLYSAGASL